MDDLENLVNEAIALLSDVENVTQLEQIKVRFLGKEGELTKLLKGLGSLPQKDRPLRGNLINQAKKTVEDALDRRREYLEEKRMQSQLEEEALDVTLPGRGLAIGGLHPVSRVLTRIES